MEVRKCVEQHISALDLGHAAEPSDHKPVRRYPQLGAGIAVAGEAILEVEAQPDDHDLVRRRYSEPHEVVADLR
jgi:hypothetical protein